MKIDSIEVEILEIIILPDLIFMSIRIFSMVIMLRERQIS